MPNKAAATVDIFEGGQTQKFHRGHRGLHMVEPLSFLPL